MHADLKCCTSCKWLIFVLESTKVKEDNANVMIALIYQTVFTFTSHLHHTAICEVWPVLILAHTGACCMYTTFQNFEVSNIFFFQEMYTFNSKDPFSWSKVTVTDGESKIFVMLLKIFISNKCSENALWEY